MRKQIKIITFLLLITLISFGLTSKVTYASDRYFEDENQYASYYEDTVLEQRDLGFGIEWVKTTAKSTAVNISPATSDRVNSPQVVNMVTIPSSGAVRIVNYTYPCNTGWSMATLSTIVKQYELNNPGWTVMAAINGDFYDINSNDKSLPGRTSGDSMTEGDVYRTAGSKAIGFTNDGSTETIKYTNAATYSSDHVLTIYDEDGDVVKEFRVAKVNTAPNNGEIAVYYTYRSNVTVDGNPTYQEYKSTVPAVNSYIVDSPVKCIPENSKEIFGKGKISLINTEMTLNFGDFAIVTDNEEVKQYLASGVTIRVQKEITGELATTNQVTGVGSTLVENGRISQDNSDGMRLARHPRTTIGMKDDGSIMFFTVDGRQKEKGMYGMTQDELGTMMSCYGCVLGFNIDGGGSSMFGVRNENGNFVITNTPSDGGERKVSNAILAVVPTVTLNITEIDDSSVTFSYDKLAKGLTLENLKINIGDNKEYDFNELSSLKIDQLDNNTQYTYTYSYDITYNNMTSSIVSPTKTFKTGYAKPKILDFSFDIDSETENLILKYKIDDPENRLTFISLAYSGLVDFPTGLDEQLYISFETIEDLVFKLSLDYDLGSIPYFGGKNESFACWYPKDLDISLYYEEQQNQINQIIQNVNANLETMTINELIDLAKEAKAELSSIKTIEVIEAEKLGIYKNTKLQEITTLVSNKEFSDLIQTEINSKVETVKAQINNATSIAQVDEIMNSFIIQIGEYELIQYKQDKIKELNDSSENIEHNATTQTSINNVIANATNNINNAKTTSEIDEILNTAIEQINAYELQQYKQDKTNELSTYVNFDNYEDYVIIRIDKIITAANTKISEASSISEIDNIVKEAKTKIDDLPVIAQEDNDGKKCSNCASCGMVIYSFIASISLIAIFFRKK